MVFKVEEEALLRQGFSTSNPQHVKLINDKLAEFNTNATWLKGDVTVCATTGIAGAVTQIFSWLPFVSVPYAGLLFVCGLSLGLGIRDNATYRKSLEDMLRIYDWAFPEEGSLPSSSVYEVQQLVEVLGPLVDDARLMRIKAYAGNASSDEGYAEMAGKAVIGAVSSVFSFAYNRAMGNEPDTRCMDPAAFKLLVHKLLKGEGRNKLKRMLLGPGAVAEGTALISSAVNSDLVRGATGTLTTAVVNHVMKKQS